MSFNKNKRSLEGVTMAAEHLERFKRYICHCVCGCCKQLKAVFVED